MSGAPGLQARDDGATDAEAAGPRPLVEIRRGDPTPEELAAVVAVVSEAYEREAAHALAEPAPRPSAWRVSARSMRAPLRRDVGWGRFG